MSIQLKLRRGTAVENAAFTGAEGELTYSTDTKELRIHDGSTLGGLPIDVVVAWQKPTAENGYTWYRKYASGFVEQGGYFPPSNTVVTAQLPVEMSDVRYNALIAFTYSVNGNMQYQYTSPKNKTTTSFSFSTYASDSQGSTWFVNGFTA